MVLLQSMEGKVSSASCSYTVQHLLHNATVPVKSISAPPHGWDCPTPEMCCVSSRADAPAWCAVGALQACLSRSSILQANSGSCSMSSRPCMPLAESTPHVASNAPAVLLQSPVLVLSSGEEPILEISVHLQKGRLQLRAPAQQADTSRDNSSSAAPVLKKVLGPWSL